MRTLILLGCLLVAPVSAQTMTELYQQGMAAKAEEDFEGYLTAMRQAVELAPMQPVLRRHCAQALARLGHGDEAMEILRRLVAWGVALDLDGVEDFDALRQRDDWAAFVGDYERSRRPGGSMELAFEVDVDDLIPEGIAYDSDHDVFYLSSTAHRRIYRVGLDGAAEAMFDRAQYGYLAGLGLALDGDRRRLWAVSDAPDDSVLFRPEEIATSALHVFDLEDMGVAWSYFSAAEDRMGFNDVVLLPDGGAVVSAAAAGALLRFGPEGGDPQVVATAGSVPGANGLCLGADGRSIYVSAYIVGILRVDLESGEVGNPVTSEAFTTAGVDGLYRRGRQLIAIQNYAGLDRVSAFELDEAGAILACRPLAARQQVFVDPTTGAFRGGRVYFIANSHVAPFYEREDKSRFAGFGRTQIHSIAIGAEEEQR